MTETEVLRRMLDERGVEYVAEDEPSVGFHFTSWDADGFMWEADDRDERIYLSADRLITPEQAIAATLGPCNRSYSCTDSERTGTCHDVWDTELTGRLRFQCSECGGVSLEITPNYCPNCGARCVG